MIRRRMKDDRRKRRNKRKQMSAEQILLVGCWVASWCRRGKVLIISLSGTTLPLLLSSPLSAKVLSNSCEFYTRTRQNVPTLANDTYTMT